MPRPLTRRQVIRVIALGGAAIGLGLDELQHLTATSSRFTRVHQTRLLMGTPATLTIVSDRPDRAREAIDASFTCMATLEKILSRFQSASQVSTLNRTGAINNPSPDLGQVLRRAITYGELTDGAFDVTVEPLLDAYRLASLQGHLPGAPLVETLKALIDYRQISQRPDHITLRKSGMAITLDGLAKGYVLDAGAETLLRYGCADVLVEAGGDMMAHGMTDEGGWRIGIQSPRATEAAELLGTVQVENAALTTSGDYRYQFLGTAHHHILNPRTGDSPTVLSSVTVLAPNTCDADALSTALMVLGPTAGLKLIEQLPKTYALVVAKDGNVQRLAGFPNVDPANEA